MVSGLGVLCETDGSKMPLGIDAWKIFPRWVIPSEARSLQFCMA